MSEVTRIMLAGPKSAELLGRMLSNSDEFLENGELEEADWLPPQFGLSTSLGRDIRLMLAIANLKASLAAQRPLVGSN